MDATLDWRSRQENQIALLMLLVWLFACICTGWLSYHGSSSRIILPCELHPWFPPSCILRVSETVAVRSDVNAIIYAVVCQFQFVSKINGLWHLKILVKWLKVRSIDLRVHSGLLQNNQVWFVIGQGTAIFKLREIIGLRSIENEILRLMKLVLNESLIGVFWVLIRSKYAFVVVVDAGLRQLHRWIIVCKEWS